MMNQFKLVLAMHCHLIQKFNINNDDEEAIMKPNSIYRAKDILSDLNWS